MTLKKIGILAVLLCLCCSLLPLGVQAAEDATAYVQPETESSLALSYTLGEVAFSDLQVNLYRVAAVSADFRYTLTPAFDDFGLPLNGIQTAREWNVARTTLESYLLSRTVQPDGVAKTDANGIARFDSLATGLYFAVAEEAVQDDVHGIFDAALVTLPSPGADGRWQYDVTVQAKGESIPSIEPDEKKEWKLVKLWKGDEGKNTRPQSVEVELFRNGIYCETVILSEETHWSYQWEAKEDGAVWTVVEKNVPQGYTATIEKKENAILLTNTVEGWEEPKDPPVTGDSSNVLLYVLLMTASGVLLILLGLVRKRTDA